MTARAESSSGRVQISKLTEELTALRKSMTDREAELFKLRLELIQSSTKVINVKVRASIHFE